MLPGDRDGIARELERAGLADWNVESFVASRFLFAAVGLAFGLLMGPLALVAVPLLGSVGYRLPDWVSRARLRARREELARDLPDAVDLLAVCTQAGLNVALALERVAEGTPGPLGDELRKTVRQIRLGESRETALSDLVRRVEQDELQSLAGILVGAERFGTKVASALENFAEEIRTRRRRRAEERARKAPVKMLFPLVFLILPGFILLTLVPLLLGTFRSLGF